MSLVTKCIGLAKKVKHRYEAELKARTPLYLSPVRRIERVASAERVCAMTFDDGPCRLPANPSASEKPLTLCLAETLERFHARGTFDVVGDTSGNYPDAAGKEGSALWGGKCYDHYPDFGKDADGGAKACPELISRLLAGGHEITNHSYAHVLFGRKSLVYGSRRHRGSLSEVVADLKKLDDLMRRDHGYEMRLSRPPHYVDRIAGGCDAYDAYALMGYQYMAASFDGAGWLPLSSYEAEVEATWKPVERALAADPDAFCGGIIFQKDGYNMMRRSPVADGLAEQLRLLTAQGYKVVTVSELLKMCPFADLSPDAAEFSAAKSLLERGYVVCYRDNTVRASAPLTRGELAMMVYGQAEVSARIGLVRSGKRPALDVSARHPYAAAVARALRDGVMTLQNGRFSPDWPVSGGELAAFCRKAFGCEIGAAPDTVTHGDAIRALAACPVPEMSVK